MSSKEGGTPLGWRCLMIQLLLVFRFPFLCSIHSNNFSIFVILYR